MTTWFLLNKMSQGNKKRELTRIMLAMLRIRLAMLILMGLWLCVSYYVISMEKEKRKLNMASHLLNFKWAQTEADRQGVMKMVSFVAGSRKLILHVKLIYFPHKYSSLFCLLLYRVREHYLQLALMMGRREFGVQTVRYFKWSVLFPSISCWKWAASHICKNKQ